MKTALDCIPCLVRQALEAARMAVPDHRDQERIVREVLGWAADMNFELSPPHFAQQLHRRVRELSGSADPYQEAKVRLNRMAMEMAPGLRSVVLAAEDPLAAAVQLAIAGNVIDLGAMGSVSASDVRQAVDQAMASSLHGDLEHFRKAAAGAQRILYLADNAGEIVFDRLLVEALSPERVTLAVRGAPVLNDATEADARAAGIDTICEVIGNGSDAPGTLLDDCSDAFRRTFARADLILAKGQGNYETLSEASENIFFLFKVKCPVIAAHADIPLGAHVLARPRSVPAAGKHVDSGSGPGRKHHDPNG